MVGVFRCTDCRAHFRPTRRWCPSCGTFGVATRRESCRDCGTRLVAAPNQRCPSCGSREVERVARDSTRA